MEEIEKSVAATLANTIKHRSERVIRIVGGLCCGITVLDVVERFAVRALKQIDGGAPFDHVIAITTQFVRGSTSNYNHAKELGMLEDMSGSFQSFLDGNVERRYFSKYSYAKEQRKIADALGILDKEDGTLRRFVESQDELDYYQYLDDGVEQRNLLPQITAEIYGKLAGKRYLLLFENVDQHIKESDLQSMGLPPPDMWNKSWWLITSPHPSAYANPNSVTNLLRDGIYAKGLVLLHASSILSSLFPTNNVVGSTGYMDAVEAISDCFFYSLMFTPKIRYVHSISSAKKDLVNFGIREDELVKCWVEEGLITKPIGTGSKIITKDKDLLLFETGKAILDQFVTRSLLVRHHPLIVAANSVWWLRQERLYWWDIAKVPQERWEEKKHVSFMAAYCLMQSLPEGQPRCLKLTTLIFRGCSGLANIPDGLFRFMPCLRVLDLSYSDLKLIPSSLSCLKNLRMLSFRECRNLVTLTSSSPSAPSQSLPAFPLHVLPSLHALDLSCPNLVSLCPIYMPNLTELLLQGCSSLSDPTPFLEPLNNLRVLRLTGSKITYFQESTFNRMESLQILDLSNNHHLILLPRSLSKLKGLKELHIHSCKALKGLKAIRSAELRSFSFLDNDGLSSFPESLSHAVGLEEIHLKDCRGLRNIDAIGGAKLRIISLTNLVHLTSLPESLLKLDSLEELHIHSCKALKDVKAIGGVKLRIFSLSDNDSLTSFPELLSYTVGLEEIHLKDCSALRRMDAISGAKHLRILSLANIVHLCSLPDSLYKMDFLEELHITDCTALMEINMSGSANMRSFFLSRSPIVELSLRECRNLETLDLHDLHHLEVLDLSFTRINELPAKIFHLPKLRHFEMLAARHLRRFPWHEIQKLPKVFYFDSCSSSDKDMPDEQKLKQLNADKVRARIFVNDPRFFRSLKVEACERLIGEVKHLSEFHVYISPCEKQCNERDGHGIASTMKEASLRVNFPYESTCFKREVEYQPNRHLCRHLTMKGNNQFPYHPFPILDYIDSLSVCDDESLVSLTDLSLMRSLKECQLNQCRNMEYAFEAEKTKHQGLLNVLWVAGLEKLTVLCPRRDFNSAVGEFSSLKHLHMEFCLRVENFFPSGFLLPSLETLTVKFCDSVKEIFYAAERKNTNIMRRLHTVILLELPKLLHFDGETEAQMPALKYLQVRGCWRLRRLPLLGIGTASTYHEQRVVEVSGEQEWWNKLTWDHYRAGGLDKNHGICFKPRPHLATSEPTVRGRSRRKKTSQR